MAAKLLKNLSFFMTKEEISEISVKETEDGTMVVRVDLHGTGCLDAKIKLKNITASYPGSFVLDIIHGYTHGTDLKHMLNDKLADISSRFLSIHSREGNIGESIIMVASR